MGKILIFALAFVLFVPFAPADSNDVNIVCTLTVERLPRGASFDGNTWPSGTFRWTPDYNQAGTYTIKYIAKKTITEPNGAVSVQMATTSNKITVWNIPRSPWWRAILNWFIREKQTLQFKVEAVDPDANDPDIFDANFG